MQCLFFTSTVWSTGHTYAVITYAEVRAYVIGGVCLFVYLWTALRQKSSIDFMKTRRIMDRC